jgi:hypothetical protein
MSAKSFNIQNNKSQYCDRLSLEQKKANDNYFKMVLKSTNCFYYHIDMKWPVPVIENKWFLCNVKQYIHYKKIVTEDFFAQAFLLDLTKKTKK